MEEIHYNKFLQFDGKYTVKAFDLELTIELQDKGEYIPDLNKNHRDYYFIKCEPQEDYIRDNKKKSNRVILDLAKGGTYIIHFSKPALVKAIRECQRKPKELTKDVIFTFERISKNYTKIWSMRNVW